MTIEPVVSGKVLAETVKSGLVAASDSVANHDSSLAKLIQGFAPLGAVNWFEGRRLRVRQIKAQERMFEEMCGAIVAAYKKRAQKLASSTKRLQSPVIRMTISEMESDLRMLNMVRLAVSTCPGTVQELTEAKDPTGAAADDSSTAFSEDVSWWDTLESLARRRNEPWREDLLARVLVENDLEPGCFRLKSLWEIGMMEAVDFDLLVALCDSSLYVDGKPILLLAPEEQVKFNLDVGDGCRTVNLAYAVSALTEVGLITQASTQFDTSEPVFLGHMSGPTMFIHKFVDHRQGASTAIRIDSFGANDVALDICRLYQPQFNTVSDANFNVFRELMQAEARQAPESMGEVTFSSC